MFAALVTLPIGFAQGERPLLSMDLSMVLVWRKLVTYWPIFYPTSYNLMSVVLPTLGGLRMKGRVEERVADGEGSVFLGPGVSA